MQISTKTVHLHTVVHFMYTKTGSVTCSFAYPLKKMEGKCWCLVIFDKDVN